jgi:CheY-like chemotaxis protein
VARLLLVDDDPDQIDIRRLIMEQSGHVVEIAATAARAIEALERFRPEVVVMDLRLPRSEDGLELIRTLRERSPELQIVVLSGWTEDLTRSPEAELVNHSMRKPVRSRELLELIDRVA